MNDEAKISQLELENVTLKKKLAEYEQLINTTIDDIHDQESEETGNNKEQILKPKEHQIDWKLIRSKYQQEDDEFIMQLINSDNINITDDYDEYGDNLLSLACQFGRINIVKLCVNLGVDIANIKNKNGYDASHIARSYNQDEILEFLLLEKIGAGKANDIVKSCDYMWNEDAVLLSSLAQLNKQQYLHLKGDIVQMITNIISNREPIDSYLINLGMLLDSVKVWQAVKLVIDEIITDTKDSIGWHYLNTYLLKNNTFLFRKYQLCTNNKAKDETKERESGRKIHELNTKELIYFLMDICIAKYNENNANPITDTQYNKITNTIISEQFNGLIFAQTYNDLMKLFSFLQSCGIDFDEGGWDLATYLNDNFMSEGNINTLYDVPFIIEDAYGFNEICEKSILESAHHAQKDIKYVFQNEEKEHKDNWLFIKQYGESFVSKYGNQRVRQDLLQYGVKSRYSKAEMIGFMRKAVSFNGLRFYDSDIYLNQLLLQCAILNDSFQKDTESIFVDMKNVIFRSGPLKKKERCKIKSETDYLHEAWPQSSCLLDIIRCTVTFEDISTMIEGIKVFEQSFENKESTLCLRHILRIKNGFILYSHSDPQYVDLKYNVSVHVDGRECVSEVQFLLKDMSKFKLKAHKFYAVIREKEYFDNLKLVSALKNNLDKRLIIFCQQGNHKGIKDIIIKQKIKTFADLQELNRLHDSLWCVYHYGYVQCLKVFVSLFKGDTDKICKLLKLEVSDFKGNGLMLSCFHGNIEITKYILSLHADKEFIFKRNDLGRNAFLCSAFQGNLENAKLLLAKLNNKQDAMELIHTKTDNDETCLIEAAKNGNIDIMRFVLLQLEDEKDKINLLNMRDYLNRNAFENACVNKHIETARFILSQLNENNEALKMITTATKTLDQKMINSAVAVSLKMWSKEFS